MREATAIESLQVLKRVPWDPHDLDRMQRALDRAERPGWSDRLRSRLAWRLLGEHLAFSPFGTTSTNVRTFAGRLWWKLKYQLAWILEPPNAPLSGLWPLVALRLNRGGSLVVRWAEKPEIYVNGELLENDQLLAEWPLVRHQATGAPFTPTPAEGEVQGQEFNLNGRRAVFRFRRTGIEEEITLTVDASESPALRD